MSERLAFEEAEERSHTCPACNESDPPQFCKALVDTRYPRMGETAELSAGVVDVYLRWTCWMCGYWYISEPADPDAVLPTRENTRYTPPERPKVETLKEATRRAKNEIKADARRRK